MRRKCILGGATVVIVFLSVLLAGGQAGEGFRWWGNTQAIYIYGNDAFTCENGVIAGSGTAVDPFIIEGWHIDNPSTDYGIYLDHTTAHVVIRDCLVERAQAAGIYLNSVVNARIDDCQLSLNRTGIYFLNSRHSIVEATVIAENDYGIVMAAWSRDNCITGNIFIENGLNALDPEHRSQWYCEGIGNFWSDYDGLDLDGDGVGDRPYFRVLDCYPLVCLPSAREALEAVVPSVVTPSAIVTPEPEPEPVPPAPQPTPPEPEPEPLVEPTPEPEPPPVETPSEVVTSEPEPEPEPLIEPTLEPEAPQTAPTTDTE